MEPRAARRRALVLTLISLALWEGWEAVHPFRHPWGVLKVGTYSDHFSHMNAARLFPRVGLDLWRRSEKELLPPITGEQLARLPPDAQLGAVQAWEERKPKDTIFLVEGWPPDKPLISSWTHNPRLYPPGDLLLFAPVAALYHFTSLSLAGANRLLLMLLILYAHAAVFLLLETALRAAPATGLLRGLRWLTAGWVYLETIHWTLEGFYDAAALAPLLLCARLLADRRGLPALSAYCAAAFLHFRSFFFGPWAIEALVAAARGREWRGRRPLAWAGLGLAAAAGAASLYVFGLLSPALQRLPIGNPINPRGPGFLGWALALSVAGWLAVAALLWRAGARRELFTLAWLALMYLLLREAYPWHALLALLPWAASPAPDATPRQEALVRGARLLFVAGSLPMFGVEPFAVWNLW